eukprot:2312727-Rhodomonas_salina.1
MWFPVFDFKRRVVSVWARLPASRSNAATRTPTWLSTPKSERSRRGAVRLSVEPQLGPRTQPRLTADQSWAAMKCWHERKPEPSQREAAISVPYATSSVVVGIGSRLA